VHVQLYLFTGVSFEQKLSGVGARSPAPDARLDPCSQGAQTLDVLTHSRVACGSALLTERQMPACLGMAWLSGGHEVPHAKESCCWKLTQRGCPGSCIRCLKLYKAATASDADHTVQLPGF